MTRHFGFRISDFGSERAGQARRRNTFRTTHKLNSRSVSPPSLLGASKSKIENRKSKIQNRPSFTLVELLVVMSIIIILMGITIKVVGAVMTQARNSATETTIRKIHGLLDARAQGFHRLVHRKGFLESTPEYNGKARTLANGDLNLQKIIAIKALQRRFFPQVSADLKYWPIPTVNPPAILSDTTATSGQLLYYVLTNDNLGSDPTGTDLFSATEVSTKTNKNNQHPCFVDAWGNPLRFYRWPTRLFRPVPRGTTNTMPNYYPAPGNTANVTKGVNLNAARVLFSSLPMFSGSSNANLEVSRDPDDPIQRILRYGATNTNSPLANFEAMTTGSFGWYHTPTTYHAMLVVSAGPDGVLGLYEPEDIPKPNTTWTYGCLANPIVDDLYNFVDANGNPSDALYDNITYLNVRAGGR